MHVSLLLSLVKTAISHVPLSADPLGRYLASACRAQSADTAAIWLWDTTNWTGVAQLPAHTLTGQQGGGWLLVAGRSVRLQQPVSCVRATAGTRKQHRPLLPTLAVTQLCFSPDGRYLASASRDRSVALFERQEQSGSSANGPAAGAEAAPFRLVGRIKAHARIVWGLDWSPDGRLLATASRDGKGEPAGVEPGHCLVG